MFRRVFSFLRDLRDTGSSSAVARALALGALGAPAAMGRVVLIGLAWATGEVSV